MSRILDRSFKLADKLFHKYLLSQSCFNMHYLVQGCFIDHLYDCVENSKKNFIAVACEDTHSKWLNFLPEIASVVFYPIISGAPFVVQKLL